MKIDMAVLKETLKSLWFSLLFISFGSLVAGITVMVVYILMGFVNWVLNDPFGIINNGAVGSVINSINI